MGVLSWLFGNNSNKSDLEDKKAELNSLNARYDSLYAINQQGQEYEKKGETEKAIKTYEVGLQKNTDTPHTYKRLAILYRKKKDKENEMRVLNSALSNLKSSNTHYKWFKNRKDKLID